MSKNESSIELQFYVIGGDRYLGPFKLTVYPSHKPILILNVSLPQIPDHMRTFKPKRLYHWTNKNFLEEKKTYKKQKVKTGDYVILTDYNDEDLLVAAANVIITRPEQESHIKTIIRGFIMGVPWIGRGFAAIFDTIFGKD